MAISVHIGHLILYSAPDFLLRLHHLDNGSPAAFDIFFLQPAVSVVSAVEGLKLTIPSITTGLSCHQQDIGFVLPLCESLYQSLVHKTQLCVPAGTISGISCAILAGLFLVQRFGTAKIGMSFSPVMLIFFVFNAGRCWNLQHVPKTF